MAGREPQEYRGLRTFQALVFDDVLDSSTPLYIHPQFNSELGAVEELSILGVAIALSGTASTLSVQIEESPDQIRWQNKQATPEINAAAISLTTFTDVQGRDSGALPSSGFVRLRLEVGGSSPRVHAKLWVALSSAWPSGFAPSALPGLVYWHDMQDPAAYTTDTGAIDSITNKVSGVVTTQATSTQRPTFAATGLNGHPCGDYDGAGTGDQFIGTEAAVYEVFDDDNPYTLIYVASHDVADRADFVFGCGNASTHRQSPRVGHDYHRKWEMGCRRQHLGGRLGEC